MNPYGLILCDIDVHALSALVCAFERIELVYGDKYGPKKHKVH